MDTAVTEEKKSRRKFPDRITLLPEVLDRIGQWLSQVEEHNTGINATRNDIVNWLIMNAQATLSNHQLNEIQKRFFDPVKYAKWAVKEVEKAAARGEQVEIKLVPTSSEKVDTPKRRRQKKEVIEPSESASEPSEVA